MGLPIAIGTKSISLQPVSQADDEVEPDDEEMVYAVFSDHYPRLICFVTCPERELQAVVSTVYGIMVCKESGIKQNRFAEVRVQISPLVHHFSKSAARESVVRLPLEISKRQATSCNTNIHDSPPLQAAFSSDRRFLACLVPIDGCQEGSTSIVVVFRLRMPRKTNPASFEKSLPPTPSYVHTATDKNNEILMKLPVATNPRIVRVTNDAGKLELAPPPPLLKATCLCNSSMPRYDISSQKLKQESALLLVGCFDGSVVAVSYQTATVSGELIRPVPFSYPDFKSIGIKCMDQVSIPSPARIQKGRLCLIHDDGKLDLFDMETSTGAYNTKAVEELYSNEESFQSTKCNKASEDNFTRQACVITNNTLDERSFLKVRQRRVQRAFSSSGRIIYATWMARNDTLAVLCQDHANSTLYVLTCRGQDRETESSPLVLRVLSQTTLNHKSVKESAHTHILLESLSQTPQSIQQRTESFVAKRAFPTCFAPIQYEPTSQCLIINSVRENAKMREAYALLWHWKSNTQGLSIYKTVSTVGEDSCPNVFLVSSLRLVRENHSNNFSVADVTLFLSNELKIKQYIRKDLYEVGLMSPESESRQRNNRFIEFNSPVFIASKTVSFPRIKRRSTRDDYELEWIEACLPPHFRASGSPCMSAIGRHWGRSIAIAYEVGLCTVDIGGRPPISEPIRSDFISSERSTTTFTYSTGFDAAERSIASTSTIPMQGRDLPKWYQFGNDITAKSFQVVGFSWWEGCETTTPVGKYFSDDILVAVLRTQFEGNDSYFLSCWAKSKLDLSHQLVKAADDASTSQWGVKLAPGFIPSKLNLFRQPNLSRDSSRKAYILLSVDNDVTDYLCFQLQLVPDETNIQHSRKYLDIRPYKVLCALAARGSIGGPADIFIAGASFGYELTVKSRPDPDDSHSHLVTIGVAREFGAGLDAMALSRNGISHVGEVISSSSTDARSCSVSSIWQSMPMDLTPPRAVQAASVWIIHLLDDSMVSWLVPSFDEEEVESVQESFFRDMQQKHPKLHLLVPVHATSKILGWSGTSGKSLDWMQVPAKTTSMDFPLGPLQLGSFDCMIGAKQQCHNLHRSLGESFDSLLLRGDFLDHEIFAPGAFCIKPPSFLPVFYSLAAGMAAGGILNEPGVFQNYSTQILKRNTCHEASMLGMQVLFLRLVERLTERNSSSDPNKCMARNILATSVDCARMFCTSLHFSMLFLEVGRQIEPGCFAKLFPLPDPAYTSHGEEVVDLFGIALDQGALDIATATLPLLPTQQETTRFCCLIFRVILPQLVNWKGAHQMGVNMEQTMRITGDLFRYAMKLGDEDSVCTSRILEHEFDDDEDIRQPSALCVLSHFFLRGSGETKIEKAAATFIISGFEDDDSITSNGGEEGSSSSGAEQYAVPSFAGPGNNVACCTLDALIDSVPISGKKKRDWKRGALIARVLMGDSGVTKLTPENQISQKIASFTDTTELDVETGGILHFFRKAISECSEQIKPGAASRIVDLILLSSDALNEQQPASIPDELLLILFVCLHCSGRSQELFAGVNKKTPLNAIFLHAATKGTNL